MYDDNSALMICRFVNEPTIVTTHFRPLTSGFAHLLHVDRLSLISQCHSWDAFIRLEVIHWMHIQMQCWGGEHHASLSRAESSLTLQNSTSYKLSLPVVRATWHGNFSYKIFLIRVQLLGRPRRVLVLVLESRNLARWFLSAATCK